MNDSTMSEAWKEEQAQAGKGWSSEVEQRLGAFLGKTTDLEQLAEETGALQRRRGIGSASDLLRMVLGYSLLDYSLRLLGVWGTVLGIAHLSKTALLKRLRHCPKWLGKLVVLALGQQQLNLPARRGVRVKLIDASVLARPGSQGADWRLHLSFDLLSACLEEVELTDGRGAERFNRFSVHPAELCIADRAYALAKSLGWILAAGAWLIVRTGWNRLALESAAGERFDLIPWLRAAPLAPLSTPSEAQVWLTTPQGRYPLRLIAQALPADAAEKARRKAHQEARKNHHTPDERSLFAAGFVLLLTNLPASDWSMDLVLQLYRFRWQVELAFKRLKSLIHLDHLPCKDPDLVQVYLLAKLFAVILMQHLQLQLAAQQPAAFLATHRPISFWRLNAFVWDYLRALLRGVVSWARILTFFPLLLRYFADEPRNRLQQLALARSLFLCLDHA